jgi:predicted acetyltransferase
VTDDIDLQVPTDDDWDEFFDMLSTAFNEEGDEEAAEAERFAYEAHRCLVARRDGKPIGTAGIFTRRLRVPGAIVPAGHVTYVSVAPTARRQGVLTRLMHRQFQDMATIGESIAVLWASEGRIYQRFGYGLAAHRLRLQIAARDITMTSGPNTRGRLRDGSPADFREALVKIYEQALFERTGWSERASRHWNFRLSDPASWRRGATKLRVIVHEGDDGPDGYAIYRVTSDWNETGPSGEVRVVELVAAKPDAYAAIWRFLLSIDLTRKVVHHIAAVDEPLQFMVDEPRQLGAGLSDALWLRIIDLPAALTTRSYAAEVDVVLEITDERIPANAGRWRLTASPTGTRCVATSDPADLACDIRVLGSAYLGGVSLTSYADAGQVTELRPGALAATSIAFGWHRAPSSVEVF